MCLLVYVPKGETPKREYLLEAACNNPHGFGYAIIAGKKIIVNKSLNKEALIDDFLTKRKEFDGDAVFHCRLATHGDDSVNNCHPFYVGKDKTTIVAHNGILDIPTPKNDLRSDTKIFADDMLPRYMPDLDDSFVFDALENWARGSKLVILTVNPEYAHNVYILNEKDGHYFENIWWSNRSYLPKSSYNTKGGGVWDYYDYYDTKVKTLEESANDLDDVYECNGCNMLITYQDLEDICPNCWNCFICDDWDCMHLNELYPTTVKKQSLNPYAREAVLYSFHCLSRL